MTTAKSFRLFHSQPSIALAVFLSAVFFWVGPQPAITSAPLTAASSPTNTVTSESAGRQPAAHQQTNQTQSNQTFSAPSALQQAVADAIAKCEPSIVAISRIRKGTAGDPTHPNFIPHQSGCGVVIDSSGIVLTNRHLLGEPLENDYVVWARIGQQVRAVAGATVLAADSWTDLAAIRIDAKELIPISLASNSTYKPGQFAIVVGNPLAIRQRSRPQNAWGIISHLDRKVPRAETPATGSTVDESLYQYGNLLQVDARLGYSTSGSAIINLNGELIGLATAITPQQPFDNATGLAIPVDETFRRAAKALAQGRLPEFGYLGIGPRDLTAEQRARGLSGIQVAEVIPGTPAALAGIQFGDVVSQIDRQTVSDSDDLLRILGSRAPLESITLVVHKQALNNGGGSRQEITVRLSKKHLVTSRSSYQHLPVESWQGIRVEFSTAVPGFELRSQSVDPQGCVVVAHVDRDSPAWQAGLRPLAFVSLVNGTRVSTPAEFYRAAKETDGSVRLSVTDQALGSRQEISWRIGGSGK